MRVIQWYRIVDGALVVALRKQDRAMVGDAEVVLTTLGAADNPAHPGGYRIDREARIGKDLMRFDIRCEPFIGVADQEAASVTPLPFSDLATSQQYSSRPEPTAAPTVEVSDSSERLQQDGKLEREIEREWAQTEGLRRQEAEELLRQKEEDFRRQAEGESENSALRQQQAKELRYEQQEELTRQAQAEHELRRRKAEITTRRQSEESERELAEWNALLEQRTQYWAVLHNLRRIWLFRDAIYLADVPPQPSEIDETVLQIKSLHYQRDDTLRRLREQVANFEAVENYLARGTVRRPLPDDVKLLVWTRDGGACVKCGSRMNLQFDHVIPLALGGSDSAENLQILCQVCNLQKSDRLA
jgi:hypothetical protein